MRHIREVLPATQVSKIPNKRVVDEFMVDEPATGFATYIVYWNGRAVFAADDKRHLLTLLKQQEV